MFDSLTDLSAKLSATGYFIDPVMVQVVFLAAKLKKPLLLEGPAGSGKTFMALGTIHVLTAGQPSTTLVMCPSHITHKWAREVLLTIPRARAFLVEDMRNGGDPKKQHGICEVKLSKGKTVYEGIRWSEGLSVHASTGSMSIIVQLFSVPASWQPYQVDAGCQ